MTYLHVENPSSAGHILHFLIALIPLSFALHYVQFCSKMPVLFLIAVSSEFISSVCVIQSLSSFLVLQSLLCFIVLSSHL